MQAEAHPHGSNRKYLVVAAILAVVTLVEFGIVYLPGLGSALIPVLLLLSAGKFALVALYFMHLKDDTRLFAMFFVPGVFLAAVVAVSLKLLMHVGH